MAIKPCKECGAPVSDKAENCPMCGAKQPKETSILTWICVGILGLAAIIWMYSGDKVETHNVAESKPLTKEDLMAAIQLQAIMQIKSGLKDPDSATINFYKGKPCGQVRAKNSFGAYTGFKRIVLLKDINIEDQGMGSAQFEKIWNKYCDGVSFQ